MWRGGVRRPPRAQHKYLLLTVVQAFSPPATERMLGGAAEPRSHFAQSTFHLAKRGISALSVALELSERVTSCPYALLMCVGSNLYGSLTTL
jgi:hypothetical protein